MQTVERMVVALVVVLIFSLTFILMAGAASFPEYEPGCPYTEPEQRRICDE